MPFHEKFREFEKLNGYYLGFTTPDRNEFLTFLKLRPQDRSRPGNPLFIDGFDNLNQEIGSKKSKAIPTENRNKHRFAVLDAYPEAESKHAMNALDRKKSKGSLYWAARNGIHLHFVMHALATSDSQTRIQWFIVCTSPDYIETCAKTPGDVYEHIGKWFFPDVKNRKTQASSSNLSMWDALVDRAGAPANQFPDGGELDFRNPNKFHPWMLGKEAQGEKNFPILYAYLSARAKKRDKIDAVDYLSQKLYGKSYAELVEEEYGKNKPLAQMPRLVRIAQNTTNREEAYILGLDREDIPITRGPGTGITTRDQFFDRRKHRTA